MPNEQNNLCEQCGGRGWYPEITGEEWEDGVLVHWVEREAYCDCPAGQKRRQLEGDEK